jgi:hypothetical protein
MFNIGAETLSKNRNINTRIYPVRASGTMVKIPARIVRLK